MSTPTPHEKRIAEHLEQLVSAQLVGQLAAPQQRELDRLLRDDQGAQTQYIEMVQDMAGLRWWSETCSTQPELSLGPPAAKAAISPQPPHVLRLRRMTMLAVGVAASIALVVGLSHLFSNGDNLPPIAQSPDQPIPLANSRATVEPAQPLDLDSLLAGHPALLSDGVATVLRTHNVVWSEDSPGVDELSRLPVGKELHLLAGEIEVVFDRAVELVIRGPARLEIRSPMEIYSDYGVLSARVGESGKGFIIRTPSGEIVDLGTEFSVAVNESGATDVAVFRGAVDLTFGSRENLLEASVTRRITQGQALTLGVDGSMTRLVSFEENRFPVFHRHTPSDAVPSASIITGVRDNIRDAVDAKFYRIVPGGLREDAQAYVDRQHQWNGVESSGLPPILLGADYVMPFNHDKYIRSLSVDVSVSQPARLYVFMSRIAKVPEWLKEEFELTNMLVGLDESGEYMPEMDYQLDVGPGRAIDTVFSVWQKDIEVPSTIVLGSVVPARKGYGFCMYGIAAVPLDEARQYDAAHGLDH